eukprot:11163089-Lingulodinium_polyedra.AAC.1
MLAGGAAKDENDAGRHAVRAAPNGGVAVVDAGKDLRGHHARVAEESNKVRLRGACGGQRRAPGGGIG